MRLELWSRLNKIEGVSLALDAINRYPNISLKPLLTDEKTDQFLEIFNGVVSEIKIESGQILTVLS